MIDEDVDTTCGRNHNASNNFERHASQRRMKENIEVQDYSFMTDRQLIEMCGRLTSCQNWMLALHSELINEKAKLSKHGQALREQIRSLDKKVEAASPAALPPSANVTENLQRVELSIPEELLASTDANGEIQLTWFYDETLLECLSDAKHPLKALSFQVMQQTEGLNGHVRTRYHTIPCSGQIEEHRFAPPGCIASRTYSFSIRARGRYEGEDDERMSPFCEPVEATPTGKALPSISHLSCSVEQGQRLSASWAAFSQPIELSQQSCAATKDVASQEHTGIETATTTTSSNLVSDSAESGENATNTKVLLEPTEPTEPVDGSLDRLQQEEAELRKAMDQLQEEKAGFAADLEARMKAVQACQIGTDLWKRLGENRSACLDSCSASSGDGALLTTAPSTGTSPSLAVEDYEVATKKECLDSACKENDLVDEMRKVNGMIEVSRGINMTCKAEREAAFENKRSCMGTPVKSSQIPIDFLNDTPQKEESPRSVNSSGTMLVCPGSEEPSSTCFPLTRTPLTQSPPTIRVQDQVQAVSQEQVADCKVDLARMKLDSARDSRSANGEANRCRDEAVEQNCDDKDENANNIRLAAYRQAVGPRIGSEKTNPKAVEGATNDALASKLKQPRSKIHELLHKKLRQLSESPHPQNRLPVGVDAPKTFPRAKSLPRMQPHVNVLSQGLPAHLRQQDRLSQTQDVASPMRPQNMQLLRTSYSDVKMAQSGNAQDLHETMTSRELSTRASSSSRQYLLQQNFVGSSEGPLPFVGSSIASQTQVAARMRLPRSDVEAPLRSPYPVPTRRIPRPTSQRTGDREDYTLSQSAASAHAGRATANGEVTFTIMHTPQMELSSRSSYSTSHPASRDILITPSTIDPKVFAHTPEKRKSPLWPVASEASPQPHREGALSARPAASYSPQYHFEASPMKAEPSVQSSINTNEPNSTRCYPHDAFYEAILASDILSGSNTRATSLTANRATEKMAGALVTMPIQLQSPQILTTTIPQDSSVLGAGIHSDGVQNSRPSVVISAMSPQSRSNSRPHPCHVQPQVEILQQRSNSRSHPCHVQPQADTPQPRSNSRPHLCHLQPQVDMPQQRSNSRSHYCVTGGASARSLSLQGSANLQVEMPQSRRNSRPHPENTGNASMHVAAHSVSEVSQPRSTSRIASLKPGTSPQKEPYAIAPTGQPPLVQKPLVMPGSSLQTNATLAAVPVPRSLSHDSFRSRSSNQNSGAQILMYGMNTPFVDPTQIGMERNHVGLLGAKDQGQSLMPSFPMTSGFPGPQPFHFAPSSQCPPQVGDQITSFAFRPDDKDLSPPPRSAPAAFQHQSQSGFYGAGEPPPPPRMAPASLQNMSSSVEAPPPPRCAPAAAACAHVQGMQGSTARGSSRGAIRPHVNGNLGEQFTLKVQSSDDRWETFTFSDSSSLDEQAGIFLRQHNLKSAFQVGLSSKIHQMIASGQKQASVDIVDLI